MMSTLSPPQSNGPEQPDQRGPPLNQSVVLYPSYGYFDFAEEMWRVHVQGVVFRGGEGANQSEIRLRKRMMLRMLRRVMDARPGDLQSEIFQQRIQPFLWEKRRGLRVTVRIDGQDYPLNKKTNRNGHFFGVIALGSSAGPLAGPSMEGLDARALNALAPDVSVVEDRQRVHFIQPRGLSVISDIDDTLKHTDVLERRALLANTFLREFVSVPGMATLYRQWEEKGAAFHYVSSSPWQLYTALAQMCDREGFPLGTFHLSIFRLADQMLKRIPIIRRRAGKRKAIAGLLRRFPQRRFILVGDSGERDPEFYAAAARRFPAQIAAICIRQLPARPLAGERWEKTAGRSAHRIQAPLWRLFHDPAELHDILDRVKGRE